MPAHRPLIGVHVRELEALLGLRAWSLRGVDRASDGAYRLTFRQQPFAGCSRRTFRIPQRRVSGYRQRSPTARPRDVRYRAHHNRRRFAVWLAAAVGWAAPVVERARWGRDLTAIDELRAAVVLAAGGGVDDIQLWLEQEGAA